ncbi:hypothetical protein PAXINDRAFT_49421, partial [Paxillus involutus ATCC 200175]
GKPPQQDPCKLVLEFGHHVYPGAHFAQVSLFLDIASILAIFDISKSVDVQGREVGPVIECSGGVTNHLLPIPCWI